MCEKTSPEGRLQWCEANEFSYHTVENRITFLRDKSQCRSRAVLHEIGHYLEQRLGFKQTFEDYRNPFAEKLLLLKNQYEKDGKVFVPKLLREYFQSFLHNLNFKDKVPNDFSKSDLFVHWQLYSRWGSGNEIPNILGVYFEKKSKMIYINTLSDIQGLRRVRYGHNCGSCDYDEFCSNMAAHKSDELDKFKKEGGLDVIIKAHFQRPDPEVLHLLCKLHKREFSENYINLADAETKDDVAEILKYIVEYKSSDE